MTMWKPLHRFQGFSINNDGQIRHDLLNKLVQFTTNNAGYQTFKSQFVHRLVAESFIPNPEPYAKTTIDHIDGDKTNNKVSNLRWVSQKENNYAKQKREWRPQIKNAKTTIIDFVKLGFSDQEISAKLGLTGHAVANYRLRDKDLARQMDEIRQRQRTIDSRQASLF